MAGALGLYADEAYLFVSPCGKSRVTHPDGRGVALFPQHAMCLVQPAVLSTAGERGGEFRGVQLCGSGSSEHGEQREQLEQHSEQLRRLHHLPHREQ